MLCIAGQTAGPIGLNFWCKLMSGRGGGGYGEKKINFGFSKFLFFHGQRRALQLVLNKSFKSEKGDFFSRKYTRLFCYSVSVYEEN